MSKYRMSDRTMLYLLSGILVVMVLLLAGVAWGTA